MQTTDSCFIWSGKTICNKNLEKFDNSGYTLKYSYQLCGNKNNSPLVSDSKCYNYKPSILGKNGINWCQMQGQNDGNTECYGAWDNTNNTNYSGGCSTYAGSNVNISYLCGSPIVSAEQLCQNTKNNSKCYNYITQQTGDQWCQIQNSLNKSGNNTCYGAWDNNNNKIYKNGCSIDAGPNANLKYLCGPPLNISQISKTNNKNVNFNSLDSSISYTYRIEDTWQDGLPINQNNPFGFITGDLVFAVFQDENFRNYMLKCMTFKIQFKDKNGNLITTPPLQLDSYFPTAWFGTKDIIKFSLYNKMNISQINQNTQQDSLNIINKIKSYSNVKYIFYFK